MDAAYFYRPSQIAETEDLVAAFVENELGRHDWSANWPAWKVKYPNYLDKIRGFFFHMGQDVNPSDIASYIDNMIITRPGRWR